MKRLAPEVVIAAVSRTGWQWHQEFEALTVMGLRCQEAIESHLVLPTRWHQGRELAQKGRSALGRRGRARSTVVE